MQAFVEFALFAWVGVSIIGVVVQLIRLARYKRSSRSVSAAGAANAPAKAEAVTINLEERLSVSAPSTPEEPAQTAMAEATSTVAETTTAAAPAQSPTAHSATAPSPTPPAATPSATTPSPVAPTPTSETTDTPQPGPAAEPKQSTLADLLAGVRLPWNLLPTVDRSREPSNNRVVLITNDGEPGEIGIDVADELERLGFTIAPRGDDTAIASKDGYSLGLQIIPEPHAAIVDGAPRFPSATDTSVALDIWIE